MIFLEVSSRISPLTVNGLVEILKNICLSLPTKDECTTRQQLRGVIGRGGFGPKLVSWLENSREVFPETVRVECPENINDRGVDVYIEGQATVCGVGFQIKSDNDLRDAAFLPNLKRQITEARAYANLKLYIVVLACSPDHYGKIQFALNEELNQWQAGVPDILVLVPGKAASLYERCNTALTENDIEVLLRDRSWHRFFAEVREERDNEFLNHWSGLDPDKRFVPPNNLKAIEDSLSEHPLTVLAGPPTIGKTYTAVQLLFRQFRAGRSIQWIRPPGQSTADFIVASAEADEGFAYRVRAMARQLGMAPPSPPRNRWEFIAARLQPGTLVLIEDPFGRTDAEYENSIHTYGFFDLEGCVEGILEEGSSMGCRLLMTTRHGLLDRWLAQRRNLSSVTSGVPKGMNIVHMGPDNYRASRNDDEGPLFALAEQLLRASGKADDSQAAKLARVVAAGVKTPQEVEMLIANLQAPASENAVYAAVRSTPPSALERIARVCRTSTDAERLFLLLLVLTDEGHEHNDFASIYARLHAAMLISGEPSTDDATARAKYWLLYYPHDYTSSNTMFAGGAPLHWGVHLTASHPSVVEAARREISENGKGFLNRLASALRRLTGYPQASTYMKMLVHFLVGVVIDRSRRGGQSHDLDENGLKELAEALPWIIEPSFSGYRDPVDRLLRNWDGLPPTLQAVFVQTLHDGDPRLAPWVCHLFRYMAIFDFDPWFFYDILVKKQQYRMGVVGFLQPWHYFVSRLDQAPSRLRALFDEMAVSQPSRFAYILGSLASCFWSQLPQPWKNAILSDHSTNSVWEEKSAALENIYSGLFDGDVAECPPELLGLLWRYIDHNDAEFRAAAGIYILVYWERLSSRFRDVLFERFRVEPELSVLMKILDDGMSTRESGPCPDLAVIVLDRGNEAAAAWLMEVLREKNRNERKADITSLIERCRSRAGPYARAFELPELERGDIVLEIPLVQVAWLWMQVTGGAPTLGGTVEIAVPIPGEPPPASLRRPRPSRPDPLLEAAPLLRDIARGLRGSFAVCAHYILSYKAEELPPLLREYISQVERGEVLFPESDGSRPRDAGNEVREAVLSGRREREAEDALGRKSTPGFPIHALGPAWR